jgi:hypothetical protein
VKTPVCWNAQCFVHVRSDDLTDHYRTEDGVGRLANQRSTGVWLAELRGAIATAQRGDGEPSWGTCERDVARRALDTALKALRARVAGDQKWLAMIDEEIGE